jgi:hypothetical protein
VRIPPLPDLDLARIAPLPPDRKREALELFRITFPPFSYAPLRAVLADIVQADTGFFVGSRPVPFEHIAQAIWRASRKAEDYEPNLRVTRGLYDHVVANNVRARKHEFYPLAVGGSAKLSFWHSLLLIERDEPLVPFYDPRRSTKQLTRLAQRFVFSVMHERIRAADPDFSSVRLGIYQFTSPKLGPRRPVLHTDVGIELFGFDELDYMVRDTYETWNEVYTRRTERERKRG